MPLLAYLLNLQGCCSHARVAADPRAAWKAPGGAAAEVLLRGCCWLPHLWCFLCSAGLKVNTSETGTAMNSFPLPCWGDSRRGQVVPGRIVRSPAPNSHKRRHAFETGRPARLVDRRSRQAECWRAVNSRPCSSSAPQAAWVRAGSVTWVLHLHEQEVTSPGVSQAALRLPHEPRPPRLLLQHPLPRQPAPGHRGKEEAGWVARLLSTGRIREQSERAAKDVHLNVAPQQQWRLCASSASRGCRKALVRRRRCRLPAGARPRLHLLHLAHRPALPGSLQIGCIRCGFRGRVRAEGQRKATNKVLHRHPVRACGSDRELGSHPAAVKFQAKAYTPADNQSDRGAPGGSAGSDGKVPKKLRTYMRTVQEQRAHAGTAEGRSCLGALCRARQPRREHAIQAGKRSQMRRRSRMATADHIQ